MNKEVEDKLNPRLRKHDQGRRFESLSALLDGVGYRGLNGPQRKNLVFITSLALEDYHARLDDEVAMVSGAMVNSHGNLSAIIGGKNNGIMKWRAKGSGISIEDVYGENVEWFLLRGPDEDNIMNLWKWGK